MSPDHRKTWKQLYNLFNPTDRLEYNQQDLYVSRPRSVAGRIADLLRLQVEPSSSEKHVRDLFLGGYVLPYSNGRVWFEPHPILRGVRDGI